MISNLKKILHLSICLKKLMLDKNAINQKQCINKKEKNGITKGYY